MEKARGDDDVEIFYFRADFYIKYKCWFSVNALFNIMYCRAFPCMIVVSI